MSNKPIYGLLAGIMAGTIAKSNSHSSSTGSRSKIQPGRYQNRNRSSIPNSGLGRSSINQKIWSIVESRRIEKDLIDKEKKDAISGYQRYLEV
jgi:hypothetical protein